MRKIVALALALAFAVTLTGCDSKPTSNPPKAGTPASGSSAK